MLSIEMLLTLVNILCSRLRKKGAKVIWKKACFSEETGNFEGERARRITFPSETYTYRK